MDSLAFALLSFAAFRITRLIVVDTVWEKTRDRLLLWIDRQGAVGRKVSEMLACLWCAGWWVTVATYSAYAATVRLHAPLLVHVVSVFGVAGAAGLIGAASGVIGTADKFLEKSTPKG